MKSIHSVLTSLAVLSLAVPMHGTEPVSNRAVVATQFAVPVGVPAAPFAPTYYRYQSPSALAGELVLSAEQEGAIVDRIVTRVVERLQNASPSTASAESLQPSGQTVSAELSAQRVLENRCAACHSEKSKQQTVVLTGDPQQLSRELRQETLLRVLSTDPVRRMPKNGPPLTESEFLALFRELVH